MSIIKYVSFQGSQINGIIRHVKDGEKINLSSLQVPREGAPFQGPLVIPSS